MAVKTTDEVLEASGYYKPILALVGSISTEVAKLKFPYFDVLKEPEKLVELVDQKAAVLLKENENAKKN